jgi:hypothetical protein
MLVSTRGSLAIRRTCSSVENFHCPFLYPSLIRHLSSATRVPPRGPPKDVTPSPNPNSPAREVQGPISTNASIYEALSLATQSKKESKSSPELLRRPYMPDGRPVSRNRTIPPPKLPSPGSFVLPTFNISGQRLSNGSNRRPSKAPERPSLPGPFHSLEYITNAYATEKHALESRHLKNPEYCIQRYSIAYTGEEPGIEYSEGPILNSWQVHLHRYALLSRTKN